MPENTSNRMRMIAVLAEAWHVPLVSLSVGGSIPFFLLIHETALGSLQWGEQVMSRPWTVDDKTGYATLPEGPGLGVTIDFDELAKVAGGTKTRFHWPQSLFPTGRRRIFERPGRLDQAHSWR